ncbi:MAG: thiamine-phosphate kinase [Rhodospirillaceae bacterium]
MPGRMTEFRMIKTYFMPLTGGRPEALGLRDDAAIITPPAGESLVVTTDALVSGRHFLNRTDPGDLAHKALAVNVSDLAAMGARPFGYTLALALPSTATDDWIARFAGSLGEMQKEYGLFLLGGDTVSMGDGPLTLSITAMGFVPEGRALRRGGANPGDDLYVSGTIGDGALGLLAARDGRDWGEAGENLAGRYHRPEPRTALGQTLIGAASACLDVSDGLVADAGHIAEQSQVRVEIRADAVPLSPAGREVVTADKTLFETALTGGDDYELAFTAPRVNRNQVAAAAKAAATPVTRIGRILEGEGIAVIGRDGEPLAFAAPGFRHF